MVKPQPSKLVMWVRFPSPAPSWGNSGSAKRFGRGKIAAKRRKALDREDPMDKLTGLCGSGAAGGQGTAGGEGQAAVAQW